MSATVTLTREQSRPIAERRRGRLDVVLDGTTIGTIENHRSFEAQVDAGHHVLPIRKGRFTSRELVFRARRRSRQLLLPRCQYLADLRGVNSVPATAISLDARLRDHSIGTPPLNRHDTDGRWTIRVVDSDP